MGKCSPRKNLGRASARRSCSDRSGSQGEMGEGQSSETLTKYALRG